MQAELNLPKGIQDAIEKAIRDCENEMDDDAESIITNQRYAYISKLVATCVKKGKPKGSLTTSDKIDRIVTNRWLGLPIFVVIMWFVYWVSIQTIGDIVTGFTNDVFVGEWIQAPVMAWLESIGTAGWLVGLIGDGIIGGVGAVIGFVPQMLILFIMLGILEDVATCARGVHHGPHLPQVRPLGQELHPHADRLGLRRAGRHGLAHHRANRYTYSAHHRAGPRPQDDPS